MSLVVDGVRHDMRLSLGALASLEAELGVSSLVELVQRFETTQFSSVDVLRVVKAGLVGGGAACDPQSVDHAEIEGGPMAAARAAAELLARAFMVSGG